MAHGETAKKTLYQKEDADRSSMLDGNLDLWPAKMLSQLAVAADLPGAAGWRRYDFFSHLPSPIQPIYEKIPIQIVDGLEYIGHTPVFEEYIKLIA